MPRVTNEFFVNIVQGLVKPTIINLLTVENNCLMLSVFTQKLLMNFLVYTNDISRFFNSHLFLKLIMIPQMAAIVALS